MIKDMHDIRVTGYTEYPMQIYDVSNCYWGGLLTEYPGEGLGDLPRSHDQARNHQ